MNSAAILLPNGHHWDPVAVDSIQYIEANNKICKVVTLTREYLVGSSMRSVIDRLPRSEFIQIHRGYFVSLRYIHTFTKKHLMVGARSLPISRGALPELYKRLQKFN